MMPLSPMDTKSVLLSFMIISEINLTSIKHIVCRMIHIRVHYSPRGRRDQTTAYSLIVCSLYDYILPLPLQDFMKTINAHKPVLKPLFLKCRKRRAIRNMFFSSPTCQYHQFCVFAPTQAATGLSPSRPLASPLATSSSSSSSSSSYSASCWLASTQLSRSPLRG